MQGSTSDCEIQNTVQRLNLGQYDICLYTSQEFHTIFNTSEIQRYPCQGFALTTAILVFAEAEGECEAVWVAACAEYAECGVWAVAGADTARGCEALGWAIWAGECEEV